MSIPVVGRLDEYLEPLLNFTLHFANAIMAIPVFVLLVQILYSLRDDKTPQTEADPENLALVVLIPAHDEEQVIDETLMSLKKQITKNDRIIVIADNCRDDTVNIARRRGIEVVARKNFNELGKGFALGFGIEHIVISQIIPDALVILDADCTVTSGSIRELAAVSIKQNRPVQALYLMHSSPQQGIGQKVAEFAWLVKSKVRSAGYRNLGLPCQLKGTGMAFPWGIVNAEKFKSGSIVEDLELGMQFRIESKTGPMVITIVHIADEVVTIDGNHPLAVDTAQIDIEGLLHALATDQISGPIDRVFPVQLRLAYFASKPSCVAASTGRSS